MGRKVRRRRGKRQRANSLLSLVSADQALIRRVKLFARKLANVVVAAASCVLLLWFGWIWWNGGLEKATKRLAGVGYHLTEKMGLRLENIYLAGHQHISEQEVLAALQVYKNQPVLAIDLEAAKARVEDLGWVEKVRIARQLPNVLHVHVQERTPVAIWQYQDKLHLVDKSGVVITSNDVGEYWNLPVVVGEDARLNIGGLVRIFAGDTDWIQHVTSAAWIGNRRWNITLDNKLTIKLPEEDPEGAWQKLMVLHTKKKVLDRKIATIDLRLPDKIFIAPASTAEESDPTSIAKTSE